jgi:hypothetical protein
MSGKLTTQVSDLLRRCCDGPWHDNSGGKAKKSAIIALAQTLASAIEKGRGGWFGEGAKGERADVESLRRLVGGVNQSYAGTDGKFRTELETIVTGVNAVLKRKGMSAKRINLGTGEQAKAAAEKQKTASAAAASRFARNTGYSSKGPTFEEQARALQPVLKRQSSAGIHADLRRRLTALAKGGRRSRRRRRKSARRRRSRRRRSHRRRSRRRRSRRRRRY